MITISAEAPYYGSVKQNDISYRIFGKSILLSTKKASLCCFYSLRLETYPLGIAVPPPAKVDGQYKMFLRPWRHFSSGTLMHAGPSGEMKFLLYHRPRIYKVVL
jgi:hypothetical protein